MNRLSQKIAVFIALLSSFVLLWFCTKPTSKEPGIYINKDPNFTIEYPKNWIPGKKFPGSVLSVKSADMPTDLIVSVYRSKKNLLLEDIPEAWVKFLKLVLRKSRHHRILSKKIIALNDGTKAVIAKISWTWVDRKTRLITSFLAANKDNKLVTVNSTTVLNQTPFEFMEKLTSSLRFNE